MLLVLKAKLEVAWADERKVLAAPHTEEEAEEAMDVTSEIVDQIKLMRARTIDGLRAKALAVYWCHGGDVAAEYVALASDEDGTDVGLLWSIGFDLIAMEGHDVPKKGAAAIL
jgi:hypothetical protein